MWADHLSNKQAVYSVFGPDIPELSDLEIEQIVIGAGGSSLDVRLNSDRMPPVLPARWAREQYDHLQWRFRFSVDELHVPRFATSFPKVALKLEADRMRLLATDGECVIEARFNHVWLEYCPFNARRHLDSQSFGRLSTTLP